MIDDPNILLNTGILIAALTGIILPLHIDNRKQRGQQTLDLNKQSERLAVAIDNINERLRRHEKTTKKLRRYVKHERNSHAVPYPYRKPPSPRQRHEKA